jgi:CO/xanthine dehydrogenase Mo-binding subunit
MSCIDPRDVAVINDLDTLSGPWSITSGNSANRFLRVVSSAVALAARKGAGKLKAVAARMLGVPPERVELANGMASAPGARNEPIPIRRLAAQLHLGLEQAARGRRRRCRRGGRILSRHSGRA